MPRGGLSSDPEARERQLAGLRQNWPSSSKPAQTAERGGKADEPPPQTPARKPRQKATSGRKRVTDYPTDSGGKKSGRKQTPPEQREETTPTGGRGRGFLDGILGRY